MVASEKFITSNRTRVLFDSGVLDETEVSERWFEPEYWRSQGKLSGSASGRGAVYFVDTAKQQWALRHCRRGGLIGRFNRDRYLFTGEERVRSVAEWRLLRQLESDGLPVPFPVAAAYRRAGLWYQADLITRRIEYQQTFAQALVQGTATAQVFAQVGCLVRKFHEHGVYHADLNCHNILLAESGLWLIDFDRGEIRPSGSWQQENVNRLGRSVLKITPEGQAQAHAERWQTLLDAYRD